MFRKIISFAAVVLCIAMITACSTPDQPAAVANQGGDTSATGTEAATNDDQPAEPAATGRDTVTINLPADISNLDPANTANNPDFTIFHQIFNRLVDNSAQGFVPAIAESWELVDDGMAYIFNLRQDVLFHNGQALTSADVVFTFQRAMESPFVGAPLAVIADVSAIDDYTVRFDLQHPFAPFLSAIQMIWIVSEQVVTEAGEDFGRNPIGTGPYMFANHQSGQSVQLIRFDDYFRGAPPIREVNFMVILNPATTSIAVEAGDIDLAIHAPAEDLNRLAGLPNLASTPFDTSSLNFVALNVNEAPFNDPLVRQAISHGIDRDSLVIMVADGFGTPAHSFLNDLTFGYSPDVTTYPFDVERARELLAEAGYPDGFEISLKTVGGAFDSQAQVLQGNLAAIGITARIELMDQAAFLNDLFTGAYDAAVLAISLGDDADNWSVVLASDGGMNFTGHHSAEIDRLFEAGRIATDANERIAIYRQAAQQVNDDAAFIPVFFTGSAYIHNSSLQMGWLDSSGSFRVSELRWLD
ncbi:MAG: ABC transporter substrate-binding protein [Defluviitaleaceae bacterium]|nr:ABC transporter substrate-binding protein [Defluviitaleaceae bacterium]